MNSGRDSKSRAGVLDLWLEESGLMLVILDKTTYFESGTPNTERAANGPPPPADN